MISTLELGNQRIDDTIFGQVREGIQIFHLKFSNRTVVEGALIMTISLPWLSSALPDLLVFRVIGRELGAELGSFDGSW
jgi:hypothetical protein